MKRIIVLLLAVLLIVTPGCASQKDSSDSDKQLTKVTMVLDWTPNTNHTGLYLAKDKGYYQQQGLDVDIEQPPEDGALSLLASGKAQFAISFQDELASALTASQPLDVVAVAAVVQHNDSGIISLKEKGVVSPKYMEGKRYATWDMPVEKAVIKNVVTKDGGDYSKVKMIPENVDNVVAALQTNIDCVWVYYGVEGVTCQVKGLETNYFAFKDINPVFDFYTPVIAVSNSYLKAHPQVVKNFLAATAKGYSYAADHPDQAAAQLCKDVPGLDKQITKASQEYMADKYQADAQQWGFIDSKRWAGFFSWLNDNNLVPQKLTPEKGFTNAYLPAVQ
jgi:ABC-type nitrate/sulfonate/bicarbonate transport system substrate-binding protein